MGCINVGVEGHQCRSWRTSCWSWRTSVLELKDIELSSLYIISSVSPLRDYGNHSWLNGERSNKILETDIGKPFQGLCRIIALRHQLPHLQASLLEENTSVIFLMPISLVYFYCPLISDLDWWLGLDNI
jgi:hypothetical protein